MKKLLLFIAFSFSASAMASSVNSACADIQVSADVDRCEAEKYRESDQALNAVYKKVIGKIGNDYKPDPKLGNELLGNLKKAQQAWLKFRDANCEVEAFEADQKATAHATLVNTCSTRMTNDRIGELKAMLK